MYRRVPNSCLRCSPMHSMHYIPHLRRNIIAHKLKGRSLWHRDVSERNPLHHDPTAVLGLYTPFTTCRLGWELLSSERAPMKLTMLPLKYLGCNIWKYFPRWFGVLGGRMCAREKGNLILGTPAGLMYRDYMRRASCGVFGANGCLADTLWCKSQNL